MAKVEHTIRGKKYLYDHRRIDGKVVCKYLGKVDDEESISLRERIAQLEARIKGLEEEEEEVTSHEKRCADESY